MRIKYQRLLTLIVALFSVTIYSSPSMAQARIATVSPIAYSLTEGLIEATSIEVDYLPPARLPINRVSSWLYKNRTEVFKPYDAYVTIRSLRPELEFYTSLRSANIHIVPIDIAIALVPGGENVAFEKPDDYFWLNINNVLLSLGILKRDLVEMWPEHAQQIEKNYFAISSSLREAISNTENRLIESGVEALVVESPTLLPFAKSLSLPLLSKEESADFNTLTLSSSSGDNKWVIDDFSRFNKASFLARWQSSLNALPQIH